MRLFDDHGRAYLDFVSGIGVASLGHAQPRAGPRARRSGGDARPHVEPVLPSAAGRAGRAAVGPHGPRARLLLQQRHRGGRGVPEVRAPLLAHTRRDGPHEVRRLLARVPRPHDGLAVGDVGRALPRAVCAAGAGRDVCRRRPTRPRSTRSSTTTTAAVIVEPIQGEGGVRPVSPALAAAITAACRRTGALLIADEVQSGCGRTGAFLASPAIGLTPDLVALGKALGAGMPVGAAMVSGPVAATLSAGRPRHDLRRQPAGVPRGARVPRRAGRRAARLDLARVGPSVRPAARRSGRAIRTRSWTSAAPASSPASNCAADAAPVVNAALERGLLVNRTATTVIRLLPPYIATETRRG